MNFLYVAAGAFFGSILRYYISLKCNKRLIGTWLANISGSVLLGILFHFQLKGLLTNWLWLMLGTGFCGAYTTFSTFGNETLSLLNSREFGKAVLYILCSLLTAFLLVWYIAF